eukprot:363906-Chlamydomonas_euryale.AAC.3
MGRRRRRCGHACKRMRGIQGYARRGKVGSRCMHGGRTRGWRGNLGSRCTHGGRTHAPEAAGHRRTLPLSGVLSDTAELCP